MTQDEIDQLLACLESIANSLCSIQDDINRIVVTSDEQSDFYLKIRERRPE